MGKKRKKRKKKMDVGQHVILSSDKESILQAGAAGAVLSMFLFQGKLTWRSAVPILLSGELGALYFTDAIASWLRVDTGIVGFTIGLTAMYVCSIVVNLLSSFVSHPRDVLQFIPFLKGKTGD